MTVKKIPPPNPYWKEGSPIKAPDGKIISLDPVEIGFRDLYRIVIGAIVPRPIAFISTVNDNGVGNLAPFSFFNGVASHPPSLMFAVTRKPDGSKKDTLVNIELTKQFVVNTVSEWMVEPMNHCSADYPYGVDEMEKVGLSALPSERIKPNRVKESAVQMECEVYGTMEVGDGSAGSSTVVVGKIVLIHISESVYKDKTILLENLAPVSRLGGLSYGLTTEIFDLPRPKIEFN